MLRVAIDTADLPASRKRRLHDLVDFALGEAGNAGLKVVERDVKELLDRLDHEGCSYLVSREGVAAKASLLLRTETPLSGATHAIGVETPRYRYGEIVDTALQWLVNEKYEAWQYRQRFSVRFCERILAPSMKDYFFDLSAAIVTLVFGDLRARQKTATSSVDAVLLEKVRRLDKDIQSAALRCFGGKNGEFTLPVQIIIDVLPEEVEPDRLLIKENEIDEWAAEKAALMNEAIRFEAQNSWAGIDMTSVVASRLGNPV